MSMGRWRRRLAAFMAVAFGIPLALNSAEPAKAETFILHPITFPVQGPTYYSNDFGAPRSGGRVHHGTDVMGKKMQKLLATDDGVVSYIRLNNGISGNFLQLTADDGWIYWYIHINNDTPGTDDGANNAKYTLAPGIRMGSRVTAGQFIAYLGDSGNAENTAPHLHFEMHMPDRTVVNPYPNLRLSQGKSVGELCTFSSNPSANGVRRSRGAGYWVLSTDGAVHAFGDAPWLGDVKGKKLNKPVDSMAPTPSGKGYYLLSQDGGVFAFGDAAFFGSLGGKNLKKPIVSMATTPTGKGYWLVASDGKVSAFGDARSFALRDRNLTSPIVSITSTRSGKGYWLLTSDGSVYGAGDAPQFGSPMANRTRKLKKAAAKAIATTTTMKKPVATTTTTLSKKPASTTTTTMKKKSAATTTTTMKKPATKVGPLPVYSPTKTLRPTASGNGYFILSANGEVAAFGDAKNIGSVKEAGLCTIPTNASMQIGSRNTGYWILTDDGRVWNYGNAKSFGSVPAKKLRSARAIDLAVVKP